MATQEQVIGTWVLLIALMSITLWLVFKGFKSTGNLNDYALGSVFFSPVAVGFSLAASMTSAATFVINPGFVANFGLSAYLAFGVFFPLASLVSLAILTKSFRKIGATSKALSLAQWIKNQYKSTSFGYFVALLSFLLITFIVLILVAISKVLSKALNADEIVVMWCAVTFIFGYMMFGGANSLVYTNTIQAVIMTVVAIIFIASGYHFFMRPELSLLDQLASISPSLKKTFNPDSIIFRDWLEVIVAQIIVGAAVVVQPHIITKSLLLKDEKQVNRFLMTAIAVEVLFFSVALVGFYARLSFPDLMANGIALKNDGIVPAYVVAVFSNGMAATVVGLLVILGMLSAGISTLEGLILSLSTSITNDILAPVVAMTDVQRFRVNKYVIVSLGLISGLVAMQQLQNPNLSVGLLAQNGVYAYFSAVFCPVLFGIFFPKINPKFAFAASITAIVVHFSTYYFLPYLIHNHILDNSILTFYLGGPIVNPALASATAISAALLVSTSGMFFTTQKSL